MAAVSNNSLAGFLQVYSQKSLNAFIASMPPASLFMEDFSPEIGAAGQSITTRIPTSQFSTLNDLANGWESNQASASAVTMTLATKGHDQNFDITQWNTISETVLVNTYLPVLAKQTANGVLVNALSNVTTGSSTAYLIGAPGNFGVYHDSSKTGNVPGATASFCMQTASVALTNNEIPEQDRYCIVSPQIFGALTTQIMPTYIYGSPEVVRGYGNGADSARKPLKVLDFETYAYPRFYGATLPYGGDNVTSGQKIIGVAGQKQGLCIATRALAPIGAGLMQSYTATDETSGISLTTMIVFDLSKPVVRLGTYVLFGTALGNAKAIIPIIQA